MEIAFATSIPDDADTLIVGVNEGRVLRPGAEQLDALTGGAVTKAVSTGRFTGKRDQIVEIVAPAGISASRIVALGLGDFDNIDALGRQRLGGNTAAHLNRVGAKHAVVLSSVSGESAEFAYGVKLRSYQFDIEQNRRKKIFPHWNA
jgi:leucyl aminopeptidase